MNIISVTNEAFAPYLPLCGGDTLFLCAPGRYALGAQENGRAAGLLLYTLSETGAVLNRLAWSQDFSEDVGRALLEAFWERLQEQDCFLASALLGEEEHDQLGGILTQAGFFPMREEGRCWEFPVGSLHLGGVPAKKTGLLSLEEAPDILLNRFFRELSGTATHGRGALDSRASFLLPGQQGVQAALLFSRAPNGDRCVDLLYLRSREMSAAALSLLRAAAEAILESDGPETRICVSADDPQTEHLLLRLAPDARLVSFPQYRYSRMDLDYEAHLIWKWDNARFTGE